MLQKRIANAADESSRRDPDCIVQFAEHRDGCIGTTKSNTLGPVICCTTRNSIVIAQAAAHRRLFATVAAGNYEVGRPLIRQACAHDLDGRDDDERGQAMSSTRRH